MKWKFRFVFFLFRWKLSKSRNHFNSLHNELQQFQIQRVRRNSETFVSSQSWSEKFLKSFSMFHWKKKRLKLQTHTRTMCCRRKKSWMNKSLDISTKTAFILCSHLFGDEKKSPLVEKLFPFNPLWIEGSLEGGWVGGRIGFYDSKRTKIISTKKINCSH